MSPAPRGGRLRFLRAYAITSRPFSEVERELLANARSWLPSLAEHSRVEGSRLLSELGFDASLHARRVVGRASRPQRAKEITRVPFEVHADAGNGLYPAFVGQFEIAPIGPGKTHLSMTALFSPPPRLIRTMRDRALLHRVAEAAAAAFMERLKAQLEPPASALVAVALALAGIAIT